MPVLIIRMQSGQAYTPDKIFTVAEATAFIDSITTATGMLDIGRTEGKKGKQFINPDWVESVHVVADASEIPPNPMAPIEQGS